MPGYKTHAVVGGLTFIFSFCLLQKLFLFSCSSLTALSYFLATILGSLFPDVDTKSKGQMIFYQCVLFYLLFLMWFKKVTLFMIITCIMMIPLLVPHRGVFHRISFLFFLALLLSILSSVYTMYKTVDNILHIWFFFIGAVSHVIIDRVQTRLKYL